MSDEKIIDENEKDVEPIKVPRGRPKKVPPQEAVTEQTQQLNMSHEQPVTMAQVQDNLAKMYAKVLGFSSIPRDWVGTDLNLNAYNPFLQNSRLKQLNSQAVNLSREELINALSRPDDHEMALRSQGYSLASQQYLYYKILRLAADIPCFKYYKIPEMLEPSEYKKEKFMDEDAFVDNWLQTFDVTNTLKKCALDVKREGKCTYVLRNSLGKDRKGKKVANYATFQKLPNDYVKLTGIGEHGYTASFNFMLFMNQAYSPAQFPPFMQDIWNEIIASGAIVVGRKKKGEYSIGDIKSLFNFEYSFVGDDGSITPLRGSIEFNNDVAQKSFAFWMPLPQDVCFTFCSDTSHVGVMPDTAGLFLGLQELADYDTLAGLVQSTPLTALLTAEVEPVNNANAGQDQTIINPETVAAFQEKFNTSSSTNLEAFFAPFKNFKLLSLPNVPNSSEITTDATRNFIDRAGMGGLIVTTEKPSVSQVKGAQLIAESEADFVTRQFESVLNMIINKLLGCEYRWKLNIWGGIFSLDGEKSKLKEQVVAGMTFMLPKLLSAEGITMRDSKALSAYVESLDIYKDLKTLTQLENTALAIKASQASAGISSSTEEPEETKSVGRPAIDDGEIDSDNTAASKDSGLDTSDTREYEFDGHCLICHKESDEPLCESCREKFVEDFNND